MIELERTFLAKFLPEGLKNCKNKEILDIYFPTSSQHPTLKFRKNGEKMEILRKAPIEEGDNSRCLEVSIPLSSEEFEELSIPEGKRVSKTRYYYLVNGRIAEIDVFKDSLKGLVLVDFEFETEKEKQEFKMPEFCLAEVTQEKQIAGGFLAGKSVKMNEEFLKKYNYKKLELP